MKLISEKTKPLIKKSRRVYRLATAQFRVLPDFIIVGAQKSGTTSLFKYLSQHPKILHSSPKEILYFDGGTNPKIDNYEKGLNWYRSHFPLRFQMKEGYVTGEASPLYLFNSKVPGRISKVLPDVKILVLLRNPVDRAISHYFHQVRIGKETLPIMEAMTAEASRLEKALKAGNSRDDSFIRYSYKTRGYYKEQLARYFNYFPRKQILILKSEDLFGKVTTILEQVFCFLGLDKDVLIKDLQPRNTLNCNKELMKQREEIAPEIYRFLEEHFLPYNLKLYDFLEDFCGW
ncbi:MAG: sulfotransferase domain-containing protein [Cyanobacteria bacterium P01_A01_bin.123]